MKRNKETFTLKNIQKFKQQVLDFSQKFGTCCFLDSNQYEDKHSTYQFLFAADVIQSFNPSNNYLLKLSSFIKGNDDLLLGHFSYDLKNEIENLHTKQKSKIDFPPIFLFNPDIVIECKDDEVTVSSFTKKPGDIFNEIISININPENQFKQKIILKPRITKQEYLQTVNKLKQHILKGDCYEINFCQEFFAENIELRPLHVYQKLSQISPSPFAAFYKTGDKYLLCASPERFIKKTGNSIFTQPMKGTAKRNILDKNEDELLKEDLKKSKKDISENVMIVDLMRNDLSKICKENSVFAEELFGIYSFPQVHQMISTIRGELREEIDFAEIIKAVFPAGSMTGAPKKSVMQLTEKYEVFARGIFSGCLGYIMPNGDFDFNVVIRSIMYNASEKYLSCMSGGGITIYSNAEDEYKECMLKIEGIKEALK